MGVSHGKNAALWLNYTDLSGYANSASLSIDIDTVETTAFSSTAKEYIEGDFGFSLSFETFQDNTDGGITEVTYAAAVTNMGIQYVLFAPEGVAQGTEPVYELLCRWQSHPFNGSVGDAWRVAGTMIGSGSGSLSRGYVMQNETVTGTGAESGYELGAVASGTTSVATYRINSITGTYAATMNESQDNGSGDAYAEAASSALASGNITTASVTRKTTTAALEAWRQVEVTTGPTTAAALVTHTVSPN